MKYYLSSYKIGNKGEVLRRLAQKGRIGYIPNALDFTGADLGRRKKHEESDMGALHDLGLEVELLDLREYFEKKNELQEKLVGLGAIFISGGNVFVLRQAMKLSGLDILLNNLKEDDSFLYAGYSAAGCVLAPSLEGMDIVDFLDMPYKEQKDIIWGGLGLLSFRFMPHWDSDHPESADIDKVIKYCKKHHINYKTVRDGEVIVLG